MEIEAYLEKYNSFRPEGVKEWVLPAGDNDAKLMLIISYPSTESLETGDLLDGPNGVELLNAIESAGFQESDYYLTTLVKYWPGNSGKVSAKQIEECSAVLDWEIETIKPKLILTLGAEPFKRIKKENAKITSFLGNIVDSPYGKLLPNYSPGLIVSQDPTQRPQFREVFDLAKRYMEDRLEYTNYEKIIVKDVEVNEAIVKAYIDSGKFDVGYDGEWCGTKMTDDEVLYTFQYSCEPNVAVVLDISPDGVTENRALLDTMKPLLEHPQARRMGWNIRVDDERLCLRGFKMPEETLAFDGMKAVAFIDSRLNKGLETGIKRYTNYRTYYKDMPDLLKKHKLQYSELAKLKFLEPDFFWEYCAGDAVSHREACLNMKKEIDKLPEKLRKYWYEVYLPLSNYLLDLELFGIPVNLEEMQVMTKQYQDKYKELLESLQEKIADIFPNTFNPNSTPDKRVLLFDTLKLTPQYYSRKGKIKAKNWYDKQKPNVKKQYSPSTGGKSLATLNFDLCDALIKDKNNPVLIQQQAIVKNLLDLGRVGVFANKFLNKEGTVFATEIDYDNIDDEDDSGGESKKSSYWANICKDGRIHASFFEALQNFRSSSRPNVQNPASKVLSHINSIFVPNYDELTKEQQKESAHLIPKNIRNIFWAGGDPWLWTECDIASADLGILAFLSKDKKFINDILVGGFHLKKARQYFQDETITKDDYSKYVSAKAISFRTSYTSLLAAAAGPIQAEIYAESGVYLPIDRIEYALKTWEDYTEYMAYRERSLEEVKECKRITNARGIPYYFEDSEDFRIMAGWNNEALAYCAASELALLMWDICVNLKKHFQKDKVWNKWVFPCNSVHDANYTIIHKDLLKDNYFPEVCKYYFTDYCKLASGDNLGMELVIGNCWKDKHPVFSKETAWDFKEKCWKWKA